MKRLRNMSLKRKLINSFLLVLLVPVIATTIVSFLNTEKQIKQEQAASASESLTLLSDNLTATIQPRIDQIDYLASVVKEADLEGDASKTRTLLAQYLGMNKNITIAYVGTPDKRMIREPYFEYDASYDPTSRGWYKSAVENSGKVIITDPYISSSTGELVVTIAKQLADKSGVLGIDMSLQTIVNIANSVTIGEKGFVSMVDHAGNYISKPNTDSGSVADGAYIQQLSTENSEGVFDNYTISFAQNDVTGWKLYSHALDEEATDAAMKTLMDTLIIIIFCIILGFVMAYSTIKSILRPIKHLTNSAQTISDGDLTQEINMLTNDEIGKLGHQFEQMRLNLASLILKVTNSSNDVSSSATQLTSNTLETTHATELATSSIQEVAATLDIQVAANEQNVQTMISMEQAVASIADNSAEISTLSQNAQQVVANGVQKVGHTVQQMETITQAVHDADSTIQNLSARIQQIDSIVDTIASIANQTNLLSLNASIEAARAGEHGKGFAVVAQEVGKLAAHSQDATKQINTLIESIQYDTSQSVQYMQSVTTNVQSGLQLTNETATQFAHISQTLQQITPMITDISSNTQSLAAASQQATASANEIALQSQQNTAAVEEIAAVTEQINHAMQEIAQTSSSLEQLSTSLSTEVQKFKI